MFPAFFLWAPYAARLKGFGMTKSMKHRHALLCIGALLALAASFPARAVLPLGVTSNAPLAFGSFASGSGGAVTISPGGVRSASGSVVLVPRGAGSAAQLTVSGEPNAFYSLQLPSNGTVILSEPGGQSMAVSNFVGTPTTGQLGAGGSQLVMIGATLNVGADQAPSNYSGSFQVFLNYN